jgi:hypothetical protein
MSPTEIAITISILSITIAAVSLGWNIYRDVILKPRVKISVHQITLAQEGNPRRPKYVRIRATNFGPGVTTLSMVEMKNSSWWKRILRQEEFAEVIYDYTNPLSGKLPQKLGVGEQLNLLFPYDKDCLLQNGWSHVGIMEYFGKVHWARCDEVTKANEKWRMDFGKET